MTWTPERTERLVSLWKEGYSAAQIAGKIGGVSREAVLGKIWRLGLTGTARAGSTNMLARVVDGKMKVRRANTRTVAPSGEVREGPQWKDEPLPPEPPKPAQVVRLADLEANQCRFPFSDPKAPDFGFCGCSTPPGASYCEAHMRVCFTAYEPKRSKQWGEVSRRIKMALEETAE